MTAARTGSNGGSGDAKGMSVLVTGAAGFIGSHLCDRLLADGHGVWGLDNFDGFYDPARKRRNLIQAMRKPAMHLVEGDVRDEILLDGLMSDEAFDAVVHLAALPGVRASLENPALCYDVNVMGTLRLLESMRRHSVSMLLFGSSASVYGRSSQAPFSENGAADRPLSPYAASKRAGEMLCHVYHHLYGLTAYCLRFFSVYGPRQRPDLAIHRFTRLMAADETLPLYGDGSSVRDYTYIDDVVDGTMLALYGAREGNGTGPAYETLNLGRGVTVSLDEMVDALAETLDMEARVERLPERPEHMSRSSASLERGRELIGYRPKVDLREGLAAFAEWLADARKLESAGGKRDGRSSEASPAQ